MILRRIIFASVLCAIAHTFGDDSRNVTMHIEPGEFHIYTENGELDIKDFAKGLIESTVKGILSPLQKRSSGLRILPL